MHPAWRVVCHIFLVGFCGLFVTGCAEYNRIVPISESFSLSDIVQLTEGFERAGESFISPDGRWMIFRAIPAPGQLPRLYLARLTSDGSGITGIEKPVCITPAGTQSAHGSFSADGLSLIFASNADAASDPPRRPIAMRIFRADGWEGMIAMVDQPTGVNLAQHAINTGSDDCQECSFSPDGKWICFTTGSKGRTHIATMHSDGSHLIALTDAKDADAQPAFSPNGKSLLYTSARDGHSQIYRADLAFDRDGEIIRLSDEFALTHDGASNQNPAWNPDGQHIVYTTSRHGKDNYELYLMDRSGRQKTRLTFSPGADLLPVFSPDGKSLVWTSKRSKDGTDEVFTARFKFPRGS